ncbi:MAG TPA: hypothetical protein H9689_06350 [Firmicutes bacterium]|nr:hypothetical protein [Bacillota bacterium]
MLPCQDKCSAYCSGCHKTCMRWRRFQEEQRIQREEKKSYLQYHAERCAETARQLRRIQARRPAW